MIVEQVMSRSVAEIPIKLVAASRRGKYDEFMAIADHALTDLTDAELSSGFGTGKAKEHAASLLRSAAAQVTYGKRKHALFMVCVSGPQHLVIDAINSAVVANSICTAANESQIFPTDFEISVLGACLALSTVVKATAKDIRKIAEASAMTSMNAQPTNKRRQEAAAIRASIKSTLTALVSRRLPKSVGEPWCLPGHLTLAIPCLVTAPRGWDGSIIHVNPLGQGEDSAFIPILAQFMKAANEDMPEGTMISPFGDWDTASLIMATSQADAYLGFEGETMAAQAHAELPAETSEAHIFEERKTDTVWVAKRFGQFFTGPIPIHGRLIRGRPDGPKGFLAREVGLENVVVHKEFSSLRKLMASGC